jgi:hypothetical protein
MEEIRRAAEAYYKHLPEEKKKSARDTFKAMIRTKTGKLACVNTWTISRKITTRFSLIQACLQRWTRTAMEAWILRKQSFCTTSCRVEEL